MTKEDLLHRADEFEKLGQSLLEHARFLRSETPDPEHRRLFWPENTDELSTVAAAMLAARTQRLRHIDPKLFGEPAWDMLLFLFLAYASGRSVTVGEACESCGAYPSIAHRWLTVLVKEGLVEIREDGESDLLKLVQLTKFGEVRMVSVLAAMSTTSLSMRR